MTKEERHLWYDYLKNSTYTFNRQYIVDNYILDFYCAKKHLAIEIDGGQHYNEENITYDNKRTDYLKSQGIKVIRYSNSDINQNFDNVCLDIYYHLIGIK